MLKYLISLVNVWWDKNTIDTRYFKSVSDQTTYFETLAGGDYSPLANFEIRDNITAKAIYRDNSNRTIEQLIACNYAIVKQCEVDDEDKTTILNVLGYRYYFTKVYQDSGRQMLVDLELDDIQSNYFKYKSYIKPCLINRAHIDRWIGDNYPTPLPDTYVFNTHENSLLLKDENITSEIPKRIIRKDNPTPLWTGNADIDLWLKNNVSCWLYVYINNRSDDNDTFQNFKCRDITGITDSNTNTKIVNLNIKYKESGAISSINYGVLVYPIYKSGSKKIKIKNANNDIFTLDLADYTGNGITNFKTLNKNTSYVFCEKLSIVSPIIDDYSNMEIDANGDLVLSRVTSLNLPTGQISVGSALATRFSDNLYGYCSLTNTFGNAKYTMGYSVSGYKMRYNRTEIVGVAHNPLLNPKYYSNKIMTLNLHGNASEGYDYDLLKLGQTSYLDIEYTEPLQPEITRIYARFKLPLFNNLMKDAQNDDYVGDVSSTDNTLPMTNTQYAEFIANNKNYWLQQNTNMITQIGQSAIGGVARGVTGDITGAIESVGSGLLNIYNKGVNLYANADNMKNAPGSLKNASSNILFANQVENIQLHITIKQALQCDIKTFDDYINKHGFAVGIVDNISNYDNIRHYFNYIEAEVETITAPISNDEKSRLRQKLRAIRFWNTDTIDYSMENYERRLNNE